MKNLRIRIERQPDWDDIALTFAVVDDERGVVGFAQPLVIQERAPEDFSGEPIPKTVRITHREGDALLQSMMDQLWQLGIRPKDVGTAGHLAATQQHLADFRALVAKTLDVKLS